MKSTANRLPDRMPTTFDELNSLHPLRPINDEIDLKNAGEALDRLAVLNKRTKDQNDYLETLILVMEAYEAGEIVDALDRSQSSGLDAIKYLMETRGLNQVDLAKLLKVGASAVSMILSGNRPITADHARNLAKYFSVSPAAFL